MKEITTLIVDGSSYAITDPGKLPQPETAEAGKLLAVETVENGRVIRVCCVPGIKTVDGIAPDARGNVQTRLEISLNEGGDMACAVSQEVYTAIQDRREVVLVYDSEAPWKYFLPLVQVQYDMEEGGIDTLIFGGMQPDGVCREVVISRDGSWQLNDHIPATRQELGDVSAALEHILALQEELIG